MKVEEHSIHCPKFGGSRLAPACITQDCYRTCRRSCESLADHIEKHPDLIKKSIRYYKRRAKKKDGNLFGPMSMAGRNLPPKKELQCPIKRCRFVGLSKRGLKSHVTRSHKGRTPRH